MEVAKKVIHLAVLKKQNMKKKIRLVMYKYLQKFNRYIYNNYYLPGVTMGKSFNHVSSLGSLIVSFCNFVIKNALPLGQFTINVLFEFGYKIEKS